MDGSVDIGIPRERRLAELAQDLVNAAYLRGDYLMSSGLRTSFYFDKYLFETKPAVLRRLASFLAELVPPRTDRLAGAELGGVPLVTATSLESGIPFVIVRRTDDDRPRLEGEFDPGERVTIIEDVLTTGNAAITVARQIERAGGRVLSVLGVLDREQGAMTNIAAAGFLGRALFRRSDLGIVS
jgi:orotate phosphoribosyltransferase